MSDTRAHLSVVDDVHEPGPLELLRRRVDGTYRLDEWGMDEDLTRLAARVAALGWSVTVQGLENIPPNAPALLVANRRLGWSEPVVLASALARRTGWVVRPVGGTQIDPFAGLLRRFGAIPGRPAEIDAALRAGNRVLVPTRREPFRFRAGHLPVEFLAPAVARRIPLVPVAVVGRELRRDWTVRIGRPIRMTETGRTAGDDARLVGAAAVEVSAALDRMLAAEPRGGLGSRLRSIVSPGDRPGGQPRWEVS